MSQTRNTTSPNRLNAAAVPHLYKPLQVPHKGVGKFIQGESQLVPRLPSTVRILGS